MGCGVFFKSLTKPSNLNATVSARLGTASCQEAVVWTSEFLLLLRSPVLILCKNNLNMNPYNKHLGKRDALLNTLLVFLLIFRFEPEKCILSQGQFLKAHLKQELAISPDLLYRKLRLLNVVVPCVTILQCLLNFF